MAGIGFELKKLFKKKGMIASAKAYMYSIFVTVGPLITSVVAITGLFTMMKWVGVPRSDIELMQGTIMYSFIFSVIFTSGYCMLISRYLADVDYFETQEDVLPTFYGSIALIMIVLSIPGVIFYSFSPLDLAYKIFAYLLYIELSIEMVIAVYVSALKDYKRISNSFMIGVAFGFFTGYVAINLLHLDSLLGILIAFVACIFLVIFLLAIEVKRFFYKKSNKYFDFIRYFEKVSVLYFTNTFYVTTIYIHSMVFWVFSDLSVTIKETYTYAPYYDMPAGFAFLSMVPTMVIFVVKIETVFYVKYRDFFNLINKFACYEDIVVAKREMLHVVQKELAYIMEIQLFFSIAAIIAGLRFLRYAGFSSSMIDIFVVLVIAYYCLIMSFVIMTILLYFDNRKDAFAIALFGMVGNAFFTYISILLGESYYGVGFLVSGFLTLVTGIVLLYRYLRDIEYQIFCVQVRWRTDKTGLLTKLTEWTNQIGENRS